MSGVDGIDDVSAVDRIVDVDCIVVEVAGTDVEVLVDLA